MWQEERQQKIRHYLSAFGQVSIDKIVEDFDVSRETIRRDLLEMEKAGELRRVRGGAIAVEVKNSSFRIRHTQRLQEKRAIAATALKLIKSGQTIFIDAGSTCVVMAEAIAGANGLRDLTIITNAVDVARKLSDPTGKPSPRFKVILLTGEFKQDPMETFGSSTIIEIYRYMADLAILTPWSIDAVRGASDYYSDAADIARAMSQNAKQTIIIADYTKIGANPQTKFCGIEKIDHLVTDSKALSKPAFNALQKAIKSTIIAQ